MKPLDKALTADLGLLAVSIIWGATFVLVKESLQAAPPFSFLFMRFTLAALCLLLLYPRTILRMGRETLRDGFILGSFLFAAFSLQTWGLVTVSASITVFITGLYVVFTPLFSSVVFRRVPAPVTWAAVGLSTIGLTLMTLKETPKLTLGEFLVLMCAVVYAVHILLTDAYSKRHATVPLTFTQIATTALWAQFCSAVLEPSVVPERFPPTLVTGLLVTGLLATVVAFLLMTGFQKYLTPTRACLVYAMEIVAGAFFGWWLGGEVLGARQYVGAVFVVAAMFVAEGAGFLGLKKKGEVDG
jgi:drug/metabolite transporter (DMT)-like permease